MASTEWDDALNRYRACNLKEKTDINELYAKLYGSKSGEWQDKHRLGPEDALLLHQAINDILGIVKQHLTSAADEYEEAMKAMEIMSDLK